MDNPEQVLINAVTGQMVASTNASASLNFHQPVPDEVPMFQVKYHHGKGETIIAKNFQGETVSLNVARIEVVAAQELGSASTM